MKIVVMIKTYLFQEQTLLRSISRYFSCVFRHFSIQNGITKRYITGILYILKRFFWATIKNLRAEITFAAHSIKVVLTTYKSRELKYHFQPAIKTLMTFSPWKALLSSFLDCQKRKDITLKTLQWDEDMKILQCLHFLSITHGVMTYNCIIVWYWW